MGRSKNACLGILTCAGAGGGGGDVAADPTNSAADANECHCEEGKVLSDKSRWSFRRRSTRHRVLRNNESTEAETVTNKENPNADQINDSNNICSPKYSSATDKTVEQEKPKENNIVVREVDEKLRENDVMIKESVKETHDESKENKESVKQTHDDSKENKESVKQTHDDSKENKETVKETHDRAKENKESFKETHDDSKENKESVKETYDELRENKESVQEPHDESKEILVVEEKEVKPEEDVVVKDVEMNLEQDNLSAIEDATNAPEKDENLGQAAVVIQSGFRGYRARKDTVVLKKVVKIQAAARGFLVRSKAVGTLRCLLAIMKMQAVVRLHQTPKKSDIITQGTGGAFSLGNRTCTSNDNLLLNGFAGKILDTMPRTKAIHIKCDPYKPDTTWQWLERWTYTISTSVGSQLPGQKEIIESKIGTIESNAEDSRVDCSLPSDAPNSDSNFKSHAQIEKSEDDFSTAAIPEELNMDLTENGVHACELNNETSNKFPEHEIEHENNQSCENPESDDLTETKLEESDVQKGGNKKAINPNFVAAQMKFQELSSNSNLSVGRSMSNSKSLTIQADDALSKNDNNIKNHDAYNITPGGAMIKAVSECGTEISVSSTLDSPDRSEIEGGEIVLEIGTLENKTYQNHTDSLTTKTQIEAETKNPDLEFLHEPTKEPKETITDSINTTTKSVEMERPLRTPEGTPISHATTTVTDLHGTPSSQSSVNTKRTKRERKKKPRGISTKRSLNSPISDSSNNNNGVIKRHGSIGHDGDSEPRISNSSLPSYMQATESARAKLHPSVSPKLSPDVSQTNGNGKKRHSLPIASAKDSSPRMERSQSHQAQTIAKGNGTQSHGSSDKRWQI